MTPGTSHDLPGPPQLRHLIEFSEACAHGRRGQRLRGWETTRSRTHSGVRQHWDLNLGLSWLPLSPLPLPIRSAVSIPSSFLLGTGDAG